MAAVVFDTGALIAIDRGNRRVGALLHEAVRNRVDVVTSSVCAAEAWRDPPRQARLARALTGMLEAPMDRTVARACGVLLARTKTSDVADAAVVILAKPSDVVLSSDPEDIGTLLDANHCGARVQRI